MAELNTSTGNQGSKIRSRKQAIRVDLTAMVDLAFLLTTFFMLTTTLTTPKAMNIAMPVPGDDGGGVPESRTLTICLGGGSRVLYYVGLANDPLVSPVTTDFSNRGLRQAILRVRRQVFERTGKRLIAIIKPSDKSVYADLVNALDEVKIADVQQYAIADIAAADVALLKAKQAY